MTAVTLPALDGVTLQAFRGGLPTPPRSAYTDYSNTHPNCCNGSKDTLSVLLQHDRLPARMRFENALVHERPSGAKQTWHLVGCGYEKQIGELFTTTGVGAKVSVVAPPSYAFINSVAVGYNPKTIPEGVTLSLVSRVNEGDDSLPPFATSAGDVQKTFTVTTVQEGCGVSKDLDTVDSYQPIQLLRGDVDGAIRVDTIASYKPGTVFIAGVDELQLVLKTTNTSTTLSPADFERMEIEITVNYSVPLRALY